MTVGNPVRWLTMLMLGIALSIATGPLCGATMAAAPASMPPSAMAAHCVDMPQQPPPPSDHRLPPALCFTGCIALFDMAAPLLPPAAAPTARDWFFAVGRLDGQIPRPATPPPRSV